MGKPPQQWHGYVAVRAPELKLRPDGSATETLHFDPFVKQACKLVFCGSCLRQMQAYDHKQNQESDGSQGFCSYGGWCAGQSLIAFDPALCSHSVCRFHWLHLFGQQSLAHIADGDNTRVCPLCAAKQGPLGRCLVPLASALSPAELPRGNLSSSVSGNSISDGHGFSAALAATSAVAASEEAGVIEILDDDDDDDDDEVMAGSSNEDEVSKKGSGSDSDGEDENGLMDAGPTAAAAPRRAGAQVIRNDDSSDAGSDTDAQQLSAAAGGKRKAPSSSAAPSAGLAGRATRRGTARAAIDDDDDSHTDDGMPDAVADNSRSGGGAVGPGGAGGKPGSSSASASAAGAAAGAVTAAGSGSHAGASNINGSGKRRRPAAEAAHPPSFTVLLRPSETAVCGDALDTEALGRRLYDETNLPAAVVNDDRLRKRMRAGRGGADEIHREAAKHIARHGCLLPVPDVAVLGGVKLVYHAGASCCSVCGNALALWSGLLPPSHHHHDPSLALELAAQEGSAAALQPGSQRPCGEQPPLDGAGLFAPCLICPTVTVHGPAAAQGCCAQGSRGASCCGVDAAAVAAAAPATSADAAAPLSSSFSSSSSSSAGTSGLLPSSQSAAAAAASGSGSGSGGRCAAKYPYRREMLPTLAEVASLHHDDNGGYHFWPKSQAERIGKEGAVVFDVCSGIGALELGVVLTGTPVSHMVHVEVEDELHKAIEQFAKAHWQHLGVPSDQSADPGWAMAHTVVPSVETLFFIVRHWLGWRPFGIALDACPDPESISVRFADGSVTDVNVKCCPAGEFGCDGGVSCTLPPELKALVHGSSASSVNSASSSTDSGLIGLLRSADFFLSGTPCVDFSAANPLRKGVHGEKGNLTVAAAQMACALLLRARTEGRSLIIFQVRTAN